MQSPTHQVQYENLGHPVMTSGFLFPVKNTAPSLTHKHTHEHPRSSHTPSSAGLGSAANTAFQIYEFECLYIQSGLKHLGIYLVEISYCYLNSFDKNITCFLFLDYSQQGSIILNRTFDKVLQTATLSWSVSALYTTTAVFLHSSQHLICFLFPLYISSFYLPGEEDVSVSRDHWNSNNSAQCVLVCEL